MKKNRYEKAYNDHEKAIKLLEGELVEIDGLLFSIDDAGLENNPCLSCRLDSICSLNIMNICEEADMITRTAHRLILH